MSDLFDSTEQPVPPLRYDLNMIPVEHEKEKFVVIHDPMQYAVKEIALKADVAPLLELFDGRTNLSTLARRHLRGTGLTPDALLPFIKMLDENRLLESGYFRMMREQIEQDFEESEIREAVCAGNTYPESEEALRLVLDSGFTPNGDQADNREPFAVYAPHIDYRVGLGTYAKAFRKIRSQKPSRVVLIGTSHYSGSYGDIYDDKPFILSGKTFKTPLGEVHSDSEAILHLSADSHKTGATLQDRAHRIEHSLELHLLLLQYLWDHEFSIVPVLVGSLDEYTHLPVGHQGDQLKRFSRKIHELDDGNTLFMISGDQAHVGHKFGDPEPAKRLFSEVREFDDHYLQFACNGDFERMRRAIKDTGFRYKICGYPPLTLFLSAFPKLKGEQSGYDIWDEAERESGVSFGSVVYYR